MLNPLLLMIILTIVFSTIFRFDIRSYEVYFLSEYLAFLYFVQTTVTSMTSLAWNGSLMKRVRVPKSIFALSTTLSGLANLFLSYIPLFAIMMVRGAPIRATVLFLPVTFLILAVFAFGVSLVLSSLAVYFEDVSHMYQVAATGLMYMTPIIYPISIVPEQWLWLVKVNPLTTMLELARMPLYDGVIPPVEIIGISAAIAFGSLLVGWVVFHRLARGFYLHI
jgi:ABC-type polysaccharide/polyol phosphate export permease